MFLDAFEPLVRRVAERIIELIEVTVDADGIAVYPGWLPDTEEELPLDPLPVSVIELHRVSDHAPVSARSALHVRSRGSSRIEVGPLLDEIVGRPRIEGQVFNEGLVTAAEVHTADTCLVYGLAGAVTCDQPGKSRAHVPERSAALAAKVRGGNEFIHRIACFAAELRGVAEHRANIARQTPLARLPEFWTGESIQDFAGKARASA